MLEVIGASKGTIANFRRQAEGVLEKRPTRGFDEVSVSSGHGAKTERGFVELTVDEVRTQMAPAKAKEIGLMLVRRIDRATHREG